MDFFKKKGKLFEFKMDDGNYEKIVAKSFKEASQKLQEKYPGIVIEEEKSLKQKQK